MQPEPLEQVRGCSVNLNKPSSISTIALVIIMLVIIMLSVVAVAVQRANPPTCPAGYEAHYLRDSGWICTIAPVQP
jgi:hypothetical protein